MPKSESKGEGGGCFHEPSETSATHKWPSGKLKDVVLTLFLLLGSLEVWLSSLTLLVLKYVFKCAGCRIGKDPQCRPGRFQDTQPNGQFPGAAGYRSLSLHTEGVNVPERHLPGRADQRPTAFQGVQAWAMRLYSCS